MPNWLVVVWRNHVGSRVFGALIAAAIIGVSAWIWAKIEGFDWMLALTTPHSIPGWVVASTGLLIVILLTTALLIKRPKQVIVSPSAQPSIQPAAPSVIAKPPIRLTLIDTEAVTDPKWGFEMKYFV